MASGANAVVQIELARVSPDGQSVTLPTGVQAGQDVRQEGSDIALGEEVLPAGKMLSPADAGLAAMAGAEAVTVHRLPRCAVASTGDELCDTSVGASPLRSQVFDANRPMLLAAAECVGAETRDGGLVADSREAVDVAVTDALKNGDDILCLSGGVSMGDSDFVKVWSRVGLRRRGMCTKRHFLTLSSSPSVGITKDVLCTRGRILVDRVLMKPGKPLTVARVSSPASRNGALLVVGLPGNPASAMACFALVAAPALRKLSGQPAAAQRMPRVQAALATKVTLDPERPEYHRASLTWYVRLRARKLFARHAVIHISGTDRGESFA